MLSQGWSAQKALTTDPGGNNGYYGIPNGALVYMSSNGLKSRGDIGRTGGNVPAGMLNDLGG